MMTWRFIFTTAKEQSSVTARVKRSKFVTGEAVIGGKGFSKEEKRGIVGNWEFLDNFGKKPKRFTRAGNFSAVYEKA